MTTWLNLFPDSIQKSASAKLDVQGGGRCGRSVGVALLGPVRRGADRGHGQEDPGPGL